MRECRIQKLTDSRGFTLVELLIATLLFSVALLGIATLATVVIKGNLISKQITTSTALAQQKMEDCINKGYNNLPTGTETENYGTIPAADDTTALYSGYERVSKIEEGPGDNMKKLTVTVSRKSGDASVILSTIIAK